MKEDPPLCDKRRDEEEADADSCLDRWRSKASVVL